MSDEKLVSYLKVLEVKPGESLEEIKKVYRELVQIWHPDRFTGNQNLEMRANQKLKEINEAYEYICEHYESAKFNVNHESFDSQQQEETKFTDEQEQIIKLLQNVPGMTEANPKDFQYAQTFITFKNQLTISLWKNIFGVDHIFITEQDGNLIFSGFVGWIHSDGLFDCLCKIQQRFG